MVVTDLEYPDYRVVMLDPTGRFLFEIREKCTNLSYFTPLGIALGPDDRIHVLWRCTTSFRGTARISTYDRDGLPEGHVPSSTFWLLDDADEIVAVSNLRHSLTAFLSSYGGHIGYGVRPSARRRGHATDILRRTLIEAADQAAGS